MNPHFELYKAAERGNLQEVGKLIEIYDYDTDGYNLVMGWAVARGRMDIVEMMFDLGADDYNLAMKWAAFGGYMDIVQFFHGLGADNYSSAMEFAALGGYMDIVQLMIELGTREGVQLDYNKAAREAARRGHMDIVRLMLNLGADYNWDIYDAARRGRNKDIIDYLKARERGDTKKAQRIYNEWKVNKFTKRHHRLQNLKYVTHARNLPEDIEQLLEGYVD